MDPQPPVEDRTDTNKEKCYFAYSARLRVVGSELDFSAISAALNLQPTYIHRKGERGHSPTPWEHDMWSYDPPLDKSEPLHKHIDALWESIEPHKEYLLELKKQATVDVFLGYRSDCETAGVEVPHTSLQIFVELEIPFGLSIIVV